VRSAAAISFSSSVDSNQSIGGGGKRNKCAARCAKRVPGSRDVARPQSQQSQATCDMEHKRRGWRNDGEESKRPE